MSKLTRKNKPYSLFINNKHPHKTIEAVFTTFHLDDIREELELWKEISLSNDSSVYDDGESRENLLSFCKNLIRLVEAAHLINEEHLSNKKKKKITLPKDIIAIMENINKPCYLSEEELKNPALVIHQFFEAFSYKYSEVELLHMLEAVITYKGEREVKDLFLIVLYRCLTSLLKVAKIIIKKDKEQT